jgi:ferredoxin-thioredoxin reductase catalytic subunit
MLTKTYGLAARMTAESSLCEALFASALQRSDAPTADVVTEAIARTVRQFGTRGCACRMAQEFGDHPEAAAERMRWVRQLITQTPATR